MAAKDAVVDCAAGEWTHLTDAAGVTTDVSVELVSGGPVWLKAATSSTSPSGTEGTMTLIEPGDGWSEATIAEKFPGVASADHLHARPVAGQAARIGISHG